MSSPDLSPPDRSSPSIEPPPLGGYHVLVVEDEYLIADDLAAVLREQGATVLGPAPSLPMAMRMAADVDRIDAAILNVNLDGVAVFPLADELLARGIPFLFLTGYAEFSIPDQYSAVTRCEKPIAAPHVVNHFKKLLLPVAA